ncbi:uncharacterized protein LOC128953178 [Oppia nitens]|uniref:uncharacterized protein LOC128953178 n=1 Tax=Oppia nitens TaxID=1686743 RepID=UPI0023DA696B|nr:uncharacterized protein LOC128953178 [Oppia nitens]
MLSGASLLFVLLLASSTNVVVVYGLPQQQPQPQLPQQQPQPQLPQQQPQPQLPQQQPQPQLPQQQPQPQLPQQQPQPQLPQQQPQPQLPQQQPQPQLPQQQPQPQLPQQQPQLQLPQQQPQPQLPQQQPQPQQSQPQPQSQLPQPQLQQQQQQQQTDRWFDEYKTKIRQILCTPEIIYTELVKNFSQCNPESTIKQKSANLKLYYEKLAKIDTECMVGFEKDLSQVSNRVDLGDRDVKWTLLYICFPDYKDCSDNREELFLNENPELKLEIDTELNALNVSKPLTARHVCESKVLGIELPKLA